MVNETPGRVDVHTHAISPDLPDLASQSAYGHWPSVVRTGETTGDIYVGDRHFRAIDDRCWSVPRRLTDMDKAGVDLQVISPIPITFRYGAPAAEAAVLARAQNDFFARLVAEEPERFRALGAVPFQDVRLAVAEMRRCVTELGFAGVEIGTHVAGTELADERLDPFFAAAQECGALVFVHPDEVLAAPRLAPFELSFGVGMPTETAIAGAGLLHGGAFDRWPNLRLCLAHGAGALPMVLPRVDRGWRQAEAGGPAPGRRAQQAPSTYAPLLYSDSLTYDPLSLYLSVRRFGADHVLLGTDYPFAAREDPPGAVLSQADPALLPADVVSRIAGDNARAVLATAEPADRSVHLPADGSRREECNTGTSRMWRLSSNRGVI